MVSLLNAQDYRWPIRASRSLAATFCEYRSGHLHAGVDIKTWGEMEVPCLAIGDGYIERILIGYHGYGRGVFVRLNDGNLAVYGHLELFTPELEALVLKAQTEQDRYSLRMKFDPHEFPVKAGQIVGYSGTSGTEHPHLHFEIRDSLRQIINPNLFYSGIKDTKAPIIDEVLFIPRGSESRVNGSALPSSIETSPENDPVYFTGPFSIAVNAHDRANGTYNKYNFFQAESFVDDSLAFSHTFDRMPSRLSHEVDQIYPGIRGKRGWRFMAMYNNEDTLRIPSSPPTLHGTINPSGPSNLKLTITDFNRNQTSRSLPLRKRIPAHWNIEHSQSSIAITRSYTHDGYDRIQFYSGSNTFIPVEQTLYRLNSTQWYIHPESARQGVRALSAVGDEIKWIIPPPDQDSLVLNYQWIGKEAGFIMRLENETPYIYPITYIVNGPNGGHTGELVQTTPYSAESDIIPLAVMARGESLTLGKAPSSNQFQLNPMQPLSPGDSCSMSLKQTGVTLQAANTGKGDLYIQCDTLNAEFGDATVVGNSLRVINTEQSQFNGQLIVSKSSIDATYGIFKPGKRKTWKRLTGVDSTGNLQLDIDGSGVFYVFKDATPPEIQFTGSRGSMRRGERLVFSLSDNSGIVRPLEKFHRATLDGQPFFPDYNPLRHELSFHVPKRMGAGQHIFAITIRDQSGNETGFSHAFTVKR